MELQDDLQLKKECKPARCCHCQSLRHQSRLALGVPPLDYKKKLCLKFLSMEHESEAHPA